MYKVVEKKAELSLCEKPIPLNHEQIPEVTSEELNQRLQRLWQSELAQEYSAIVIYADREHFSNVHYFTNYDPRFEEALLLLRRGCTPWLLIGNEGYGYSPIVPVEVHKELFQSFSLMGQPNESSRTLKAILADFLRADDHVGLIGWKEYASELFTDELVTDVPHYIVRELEEAVGHSNIKNATAIMSHCILGMKHQLDAREIVRFEASGTKLSRNVYQCLKNLKPGMTEIEASGLIPFDGDPLNVHPNINFGAFHNSLGLCSPLYHEKLEYGKGLGVGYGLRGSLVHKSGMYIRSREDLPEGYEHYLDEFVKPYFASCAKWYEMMRIGTKFGDIYQMVEDWIGFDKFHIGLNPGHQIHTDEWTTSPLTAGNTQAVASGCAYQCDYTVSFHEPFMSCHIEDGVVIADEALRAQIEAISPDCMCRIRARQEYMRTVLGIDLADETLPMSDLPCVCFPYMADLSTVLAKA